MTSMLPDVREEPPIALAGRVDRAMVIDLQCRITAALDAGQADIVIDLGAVTAIGTPTLSVLCVALRRIDRRGATISILDAHTIVRRALASCEIEGLGFYATAASDIPLAQQHCGDSRAASDTAAQIAGACGDLDPALTRVSPG